MQKSLKKRPIFGFLLFGKKDRKKRASFFEKMYPKMVSPVAPRRYDTLCGKKIGKTVQKPLFRSFLPTHYVQPYPESIL